jgi:hypothetical protein
LRNSNNLKRLTMPILNDEQVNAALLLMHSFSSAPRISKGTLPTELEVQAERDRKRVEVIENILKPLVRNYLNGEVQLSEFKTKVDSTNKSNGNPWGFSGMIGQMFFNMIFNKVASKQEFDLILKQVIVAPENEEMASNLIQTFVSYIKDLGDEIESAVGKKTGRPKLGSILYFLSYFWQIQARDIWPVYYPSATEVMQKFNFWQQSGDLGQDYLKYKHIYEELLPIFSREAGRRFNLYDVEHVFWFDNEVKKSEGVPNQEDAKPVVEKVKTKSQLVLIGTSKNALESYDRIKQAIADRGGWASWWSFTIGEDVKAHLRTPFYLFINIGGGKFPIRYKITDFSVSHGDEGLQSPWPEITDPEYTGITRMGEKKSVIFKTWFKVSEIERDNPPLMLSDFEPADPWSNEKNLINQNAFGFAYLREKGATPMTLYPPIQYPLNQILYGPPGTGKTYYTIDLAIKVIGKDTKTHEGNREIYQRLLGDQIEFITFHQNYAYEDFIQGLRPDLDKQGNGALSFILKDGIFKRISDRALKNYKASNPNFGNEKKVPFDKAFKDFVHPIESGEKDEIEVPMTKVSFHITGLTDKSISFRKQSGGTSHTLSISTLSEMYDKEDLLGIQGLTVYYKALLDILLVKGKESISDSPYETLKNYVLIIDEINRANISRVFGELITLIEEDKRFNQENEMITTLASGEKFTVPPNLFIIGTMNTADKSIALIDIALRRRFVFEKMYPDPELITEKEYLHLFNELNNQIRESKGADFQIGHSFFRRSNGVQTFDLKDAMNKKIIPLLYEYFMNDGEAVDNILKKSGIETRNNVGIYEFLSYKQ